MSEFNFLHSRLITRASTPAFLSTSRAFRSEALLKSCRRTSSTLRPAYQRSLIWTSRSRAGPRLSRLSQWAVFIRHYPMRLRWVLVGCSRPWFWLSWCRPSYRIMPANICQCDFWVCCGRCSHSRSDYFGHTLDRRATDAQRRASGTLALGRFALGYQHPRVRIVVLATGRRRTASARSARAVMPAAPFSSHKRR